jgi:ribosomal protein S18 acetylase RimI-like enzyme
MHQGVTIRPPSDQEIATVAVLFREYAASLNVDLSYQGFAAELATLPGPYASPAGILLLAVAPHGDPFGCIAVRALPEDGTCEMKRLYTRPAARGMGLGRALAQAAIEAATRSGYRAMRLDTLPTMHAAQSLYRGLGFDLTPAYYDSPVTGTIFMRKILAPALTAKASDPSSYN